MARSEPSPAVPTGPLTERPHGERESVWPIWFLHGGGLPLVAIGEQLSALGVLGKPASYFDHDVVMFKQAGTAGARTFETYVKTLLSAHRTVFSVMLPATDLVWLESEKTLAPLLRAPARFVHLCYRDPVLQAIGILAETASCDSDEPDDNALIDALLLLEDREASVRAWLAERGQQVAELRVEELAAPGVAALRHLLDDWSVTLPDHARIRPIQTTSDRIVQVAEHARKRLKAVQWSHAAPLKGPHWRRRFGR